MDKLKREMKRIVFFSAVLLVSCTTRPCEHETRSCKGLSIWKHTFLVLRTVDVFSHTSKRYNVTEKRWQGKCIVCGDIMSSRYGYKYESRWGHGGFETCDNYCPSIGDTVYHSTFNFTKKK